MITPNLAKFIAFAIIAYSIIAVTIFAYAWGKNGGLQTHVSDARIYQEAGEVVHRYNTIQAGTMYVPVYGRNARGEIVPQPGHSAHCPSVIKSQAWTDYGGSLDIVANTLDGIPSWRYYEMSNQEKLATIRQIHADIDQFLKTRREAGCH